MLATWCLWCFYRIIYGFEWKIPWCHGFSHCNHLIQEQYGLQINRLPSLIAMLLMTSSTCAAGPMWHSPKMPNCVPPQRQLLQEAYVLQTHTQHGPVVQNYYMFINNVKQQELCSSCKTIFTSRKRNLINKTHVETYQKRPLRSLRFGCRGKSLLHQRSSQCVRCTKPARLEVEHSQVAGNQQEILIVKAATLRKMMQNYINSKHMKKICQHM